MTGAHLLLLKVTTDDHCGCRVEDLLFDGADLNIHYEDGNADACLDIDPDNFEAHVISLPARTVRQGRLSVLQWADSIMGPYR